jgi:hypothetical protein
VTVRRVFSQRRWAFRMWAIGSFNRMCIRWEGIEAGVAQARETHAIDGSPDAEDSPAVLPSP